MVKRILFAFFFLWLIASPVYAQPTTILVSFDTASLSWTWGQGTGGLPTEFRVKCGVSSGVYATTKVLADSAARSVLVSAVISQVGLYYCAVSAANQFGESGLSNEVSFQAGRVPSDPTGLTVQAH